MNPFLAGLMGGYGTYAGQQPQQERSSFFAPFDLAGYQTPNVISDEEIARRERDERMRNFWLGLSQGALTGQWGGVGKGIGAGLAAGAQSATAERDKMRKYNDDLRQEALNRQRLAMEEQFRKPQEELNILQLAESKRKMGEDEQIRTVAKTDIPSLIDQAKESARAWVEAAGTNKDLASSRFLEAKNRIGELQAMGQRASIDESYFEKFKATFDTALGKFGSSGVALEKTSAEIAEEAAKLGMTPDEWIKFNRRGSTTDVTYKEAMIDRLRRQGGEDENPAGMRSGTTIVTAVRDQRKVLEESIGDLRRIAKPGRTLGINGDAALTKWGLNTPEFIKPLKPGDPDSPMILSEAGLAAVNAALSMGDDYINRRAKERANESLIAGTELFEGRGSSKSGSVGDPTSGPMEPPAPPKSLDDAIREWPQMRDKIEAARKEKNFFGQRAYSDEFILNELLKDGVLRGLWTRESILGNK